MRALNPFAVAIVLAGIFASAAAAQTQTANRAQLQTGSSTAGAVTTVDQAIDLIIAREHDEVAVIRQYSPIVETYVQDINPMRRWASCLFAITISWARRSCPRESSTTRC